MGCVKEVMEKFVIVDMIYPEQIISSNAKVFDVDLRTCQVSDLEFAN